MMIPPWILAVKRFLEKGIAAKTEIALPAPMVRGK
jgi:hypothetical protein